MKKVLLIGFAVLMLTAGSTLAQMGGEGHMMGTSRQAQAQPRTQQGAQPHYGMMGYGMQPGVMGGYGMYPGMMGGYGMPMPMPGYGMPHMHHGMTGGYGMQMPMAGCGMYPGMTGGYGMPMPMTGYGMGQMHPGMTGGYGMPHLYPGAGSGLEKQRKFMKETSPLRKKLHDLMFDYMEARWDPETEPAQLEELAREMQVLQKELYEKSQELLK